MKGRVKDCITITTWQTIETNRPCVDIVTTAPIIGALPSGHFSGIYGYTSQAAILPLASIEAQKAGKKIRIFSVFVPTPKPSVLLTLQNRVTRTFLRLDAISNAVQRELSLIMGVSGEILPAVAREPDLIKKIWEDERYKHLTAISWVSEFRVALGYYNVAVCTVRKASDISRIQRMHPVEEIPPGALILD